MQARLEQVRQSALRARHLVQQITAFGRRQPHLALVQPLVQDTLALMLASLPASVRWTAPAWLRPPASTPGPSETSAAPALQVEGDASQIQQVLMHLCTNAWQAMPDGVGEIEVGLPAGLCAHLWVRDSGRGMNEAMRSPVFEPFLTTKPVGSGTGLGLAVVQGIVAEHRGLITVDSAPGRGAMFHLVLPAQGQPAQTGQARPEPVAGTVGVRGLARKEHTVDDLGPAVLRAPGPPGSASPVQ